MIGKCYLSGISLQTKRNIYHVIITINVFKSVFTYISYQPAPRQKLLRQKYQLCHCLFFFFFYICVPKSTRECFTDAWLMKQKKKKKVPWRPFQSTVHLSHLLWCWQTQYHLLQYTCDMYAFDLTCWMSYFYI